MAALLVGSFGARIAGAALGLATQILLARNFSQSDVGTVFLTMSLASLLSIVSSLGYPALALTQLPQYFESNFGRAISAFHGLYLRDALSVTLLLAIVLYVGSLLFPVHEELRLAFIFGLLSAPFSSLIYYNCSVANSARRFVLSSMSDNIVRPGLFFCWVLVSVYLDWKLSIESILSIYVLSNVATAAIQYATLGKDAPSPLHMTNRKAAFSNSLRPRAASLAIVTGLSVAIADIITFLSGVFLEPADVAIVGVTIRLAAIVGFAIQSVQQFILPDLMKSIAKDEVDASNNILFKSTALTTVTMFVAIIVVITVGEFILRLLGKEY